MQQDAAEFLMWLLDALHRTLNCSRRSSPNHNGSILGKKRPVIGREVAYYPGLADIWVLKGTQEVELEGVQLFRTSNPIEHALSFKMSPCLSKLAQ